MGKGIRIAGLWPKGSLDSRAKAASSQEPALSSINVEGIAYVFGLDWRMLPPTRRLRSNPTTALRFLRHATAISRFTPLPLGDGDSSPRIWSK
jgi:hypothetical protein